jgi:hypothetical protein
MVLMAPSNERSQVLFVVLHLLHYGCCQVLVVVLHLLRYVCYHVVCNPLHKVLVAP